MSFTLSKEHACHSKVKIYYCQCHLPVLKIWIINVSDDRQPELENRQHQYQLNSVTIVTKTNNNGCLSGLRLSWRALFTSAPSSTSFYIRLVLLIFIIQWPITRREILRVKSSRGEERPPLLSRYDDDETDNDDHTYGAGSRYTSWCVSHIDYPKTNLKVTVPGEVGPSTGRNSKTYSFNQVEEREDYFPRK
jgi:hypothetical protein